MPHGATVRHAVRLGTCPSARHVARYASAALLLGGVLCTSAAQAATLYDAALGTLPSAQNWTPLAAGSGAVQSVSAGRYRLDTTAGSLSQFGYAAISPIVLNTATGFDLSFSLQITSEAHTSANRAGYSMLFVGADATQALELGFWPGNVWAYDYDATQADRFVHGLDAAFDTTALHNYTLSVRNQHYSLLADGNLLLSGSLHDYTAFGLPYTQPNLVFFGDDSSRGVSVSELALVTVTAVPEPASAALLLAGLGLFSVGWAAAGPGRRWPRR